MIADGTVLARKRHYGSRLRDWPRNVLQWLIVVFTGHSYVHLAIYLHKCTWESTGIGGWGAKQTPGQATCNELWEPVVPLTRTEAILAVEWASKSVRKKRPYNILKFLAFPLRGLWRVLHWAPFDAPWFGEYCFSFVDECYLAAGRDVVPGQRGYVTAHDFLKTSGKFRRIA